jgi:hypothetical protein
MADDNQADLLDLNNVSYQSQNYMVNGNLAPRPSTQFVANGGNFAPVSSTQSPAGFVQNGVNFAPGSSNQSSVPGPSTPLPAGFVPNGGNFPPGSSTHLPAGFVPNGGNFAIASSNQFTPGYVPNGILQGSSVKTRIMLTLTPNTPLIHIWFTYSIWNMGEICGLKFHLIYSVDCQ